MTVQLKSSVQPTGLITPSEFKDQADNEADEYWGVPMEFFTVKQGDVLLDSRVASKLAWVVNEQIGDTLSISAKAQSITVNGQEIAVNPAFWCSNVSEDDIQS